MDKRPSVEEMLSLRETCTEALWREHVKQRGVTMQILIVCKCRHSEWMVMDQSLQRVIMKSQQRRAKTVDDIFEAVAKMATSGGNFSNMNLLNYRVNTGCIDKIIKKFPTVAATSGEYNGQIKGALYRRRGESARLAQFIGTKIRKAMNCAVNFFVSRDPCSCASTLIQFRSDWRFGEL